MLVVQFELNLKPLFSVIPSRAGFQAERGISLFSGLARKPSWRHYRRSSRLSLHWLSFLLIAFARSFSWMSSAIFCSVAASAVRPNCLNALPRTKWAWK